MSLRVHSKEISVNISLIIAEVNEQMSCYYALFSKDIQSLSFLFLRHPIIAFVLCWISFTYKMSEIEDAIQFLVDHGKADVALKIKEFFDLHSSKDQVWYKCVPSVLRSCSPEMIHVHFDCRKTLLKSKVMKGWPTKARCGTWKRFFSFWSSL